MLLYKSHWIYETSKNISPLHFYFAVETNVKSKLCIKTNASLINRIDIKWMCVQQKNWLNASVIANQTRENINENL